MMVRGVSSSSSSRSSSSRSSSSRSSSSSSVVVVVLVALVALRRCGADRRVKKGFEPSWARGETSTVFATPSEGVKLRLADEVTKSLEWSEERHCSPAAPSKYARPRVAVALAFDGEDPIPALAVINSTFAHARDMSKVEFVVVTTAPETLLALLRTPSVRDALPVGSLGRVRVCGNFSAKLLARPALEALAKAFLNDTALARRVRRRELLSPFNFAAFYLPHVLAVDRILYLDTDTVVQGDILAAVEAIDMGFAAVAAAEDCSQRIGKYVNFPVLVRYLRRSRLKKRLQVPLLGNETTCVFNRGVVLFDAARWRKLGLTRTVEELVMCYIRTSGRLWRGGVSQPPFLLALAGRYRRLSLEWNVRGLGRVDISHEELHAGLVERDDSEMRVVLDHVYRVGTLKAKFHPFVAPLAARALVLHFNGEAKPWLLSRAAAEAWWRHGLVVTKQGHVESDCVLDPNITSTMKREHHVCRDPATCGSAPLWANHPTPASIFVLGCAARLALCSSRTHPMDVIACAQLWHEYVNEDARGVARRLLPLLERKTKEEEGPVRQKPDEDQGRAPPKKKKTIITALDAAQITDFLTAAKAKFDDDAWVPPPASSGDGSSAISVYGS